MFDLRSLHSSGDRELSVNSYLSPGAVLKQPEQRRVQLVRPCHRQGFPLLLSLHFFFFPIQLSCGGFSQQFPEVKQLANIKHPFSGKAAIRSEDIGSV